MSALPRNPRYWPRMKVRGARRRRLAYVQRRARAVDQMVIAFARLATGTAETAVVVKWIDPQFRTLATEES